VVGQRAVTDEARVVERLAERLRRLDGHGIGEVDHRVLQQRVRGAVRHAPNLRVEFDVVERDIALRDLDVLADRAGREAAGATGVDERVGVHVDPLGLLREHAKLLDKPDDLRAEFGAGEDTAESVDATGLSPALDTVIVAPPTGLGIAEHVALDVHPGPVGPLGRIGAAERLEGAVRLRHGVVTLLHGRLLRLGGLDHLGGSRTLQHGTQFDFLRLHPLQELDPLAELVGPLLQRPQRGFLLLGHRGVVALGGTFGHRLHLGDDSGEFVEQCLDLVHGGIS
jgi:hypothetical protein